MKEIGRKPGRSGLMTPTNLNLSIQIGANQAGSLSLRSKNFITLIIF
jgi:hypothetical protein